MASTVTVTGKVEGGLTMTAKVFTNVHAFKVDCDRQALIVTQSNDDDRVVDISAATTITATASSGSYTITIS